MTAAPAGQTKADAENPPLEAAPEPGTPELPPVDLSVPEGKVEVSRPAKTAKERKVSDPAGQVTEQATPTRRTKPKSDVFELDKNGSDKVDRSKLPVSVASGDVIATIKEYANRPVLELSLVGWVGDVPFKVLATDIPKIEQVFAELRKQLGA